MRARREENVRHMAMWAAREGGTRMVEASRTLGRANRECSIAAYGRRAQEARVEMRWERRQE